MRRRALVALMAGTMALAMTPTAVAAVSSDISIGYNHATERFHGAVTSPDAECQAGRTVRLFKETASGRSLQGKTMSDGDGGWRIEVMHAHGHYFAVTPEEKIMHTMCGKARSRTIDVT